MQVQGTSGVNKPTHAELGKAQSCEKSAAIGHGGRPDGGALCGIKTEPAHGKGDKDAGGAGEQVVDRQRGADDRGQHPGIARVRGIVEQAEARQNTGGYTNRHPCNQANQRFTVEHFEENSRPFFSKGHAANRHGKGLRAGVSAHA